MIFLTALRLSLGITKISPYQGGPIMMRHADSFLVRNLVFVVTATATFLVGLGVSTARGWVNHSHGIHHVPKAKGHAATYAAEEKTGKLSSAAALIFFCRALLPYSVLCAVATSLLFTRHPSIKALLNNAGVHMGLNDWLLTIVADSFLLLIWAFFVARSYIYEVRKDGLYLQHGIFYKKATLISYDDILSVRIDADDIHALFGLTAINIEAIPSDTGWLSLYTIPGLRFDNAQATCEKLVGMEA
jgi:membrane protein YdbS with pleckstrin-like domain